MSSPCAPAAGCSVMASMPVISMQALAQGLDDAQGALRNSLGLVRMSVGQAFEAHHQLIHARVVLHGA